MNTPQPFLWLQGDAFDAWAEENKLEVAPLTVGPELVWVDMETTGLDGLNEVPLEVGLVLTDKFGHVIKDCAASWFVFDDYDFYWARKVEMMTDFVREMHTKSGLLDDLAELAKQPASRQTARQVESQAMHWLGHRFGRTFEGKDRKVPYGSSLSLDREFMKMWMSELNEWFHYRIGDVSSMREILKPLCPEVDASAPKKRDLHRPLPDIADSIHLYRHLITSTGWAESVVN